MVVIPRLGSFEYVALTGDWRLVVGNGEFNLLPQVGGLEYS